MMQTPGKLGWPAVLTAVCVLTAPARAAIVFADDFDLPSGANYAINADPDTQIEFAYNYGLDGIPSSPNGSGTTLGVKFQANMFDPGLAAAINISPLGQSFTGDFVVRFDMWINVNGPFPDGGTGSTEFVTAGIGTAGLTVQKTGGGSSADGTWFAVDGEGGSGIDFRAYQGTVLEGPASLAYAAQQGTGVDVRSANHTFYHGVFPGGQQAPLFQQTAFANQQGALKAGTVGFRWSNVAIEKTGDDVVWTLDGLTIATMTNANITGDNIFIGYWDVFNSVSDNPAMSFGLIDNLRVEVVPEPASSLVTLAGVLSLCGIRRRRR